MNTHHPDDPGPGSLGVTRTWRGTAYYPTGGFPVKCRQSVSVEVAAASRAEAVRLMLRHPDIEGRGIGIEDETVEETTHGDQRLPVPEET